MFKLKRPILKMIVDVVIQRNNQIYLKHCWFNDRFFSTSIASKISTQSHSLEPNIEIKGINLIKNMAHGGKVRIQNGLPMIDVTLPSRRENCMINLKIIMLMIKKFLGQFIMRPMSDTVGSICEALINEDSGIEVVTFYTKG